MHYQPIKVKHKKVFCNGINSIECNGINSVEIDKGNCLGHPLIYLDIGSEDSITCPYCSKVFIYSCVEKIENRVKTDSI